MREFGNGSSVDDVAAAAELAAEVLDTKGWVRNVMGGEGYGFCMLGALRWGYITKHYVHEVFVDAMEALRNHIRTRSIVGWNDNVCRNKDEARDKFIELAKDLRNLA